MSAAVHQIAPHIPRSPQLENGYYSISTELDEAILAADLTGNEALVLRTIMRKTYGYHKKQDDCTASQIGELCRMASRHVTTILNSLAKKQFIHKRTGSYGCVIGIQKDYSRWPMRPMPEEYQNGGKKRRGRPSLHDDATALDNVHAAAEEQKTPPNLGVVLPIHEEKPLQDSEKPLRDLEETPPNFGDTKDNSKDKGQKKEKPLSGAALPDGFDAFWDAYPRGEKKKAAVESWKKLNPDAELQAKILASLKEHEKTDQWKRGIYPHAVTFLNQKQWTDKLRVSYSDAELTVLRNYNEMIGAKIDKFVEEESFSEERAQMAKVCLQELDEIVGHSDRGEYSARYFAFILKHCPPHLLAHMTPERVMRSVAKIVNKDFSR